MSEPTNHTDLARRGPQPLAIHPKQPAVTEQQPQRIVVHIVQHPAATTNPRPAHYTTEKSRGTPPQPLPSVPLPNLLTLTLSVVVALLLVVSASMFSIALTAYSNSVDRVDNNRSFLQVD